MRIFTPCSIAASRAFSTELNQKSNSKNGVHPGTGFFCPTIQCVKGQEIELFLNFNTIFFSKIKELIFFHLGKILNLYFPQNSRKKPVEEIRGNSDRTNTKSERSAEHNSNSYVFSHI